MGEPSETMFLRIATMQQHMQDMLTALVSSSVEEKNDIDGNATRMVTSGGSSRKAGNGQDQAPAEKELSVLDCSRVGTVAGSVRAVKSTPAKVPPPPPLPPPSNRSLNHYV